MTRQGVFWVEIELAAQNPGKGVGLFAKVDLPENLCIPYGGIYLNPPERDKLWVVRHGNEGKRHRHISHGAAVQCVCGDGGGRAGNYHGRPSPEPGSVVTATKQIGAKI